MDDMTWFMLGYKMGRKKGGGGVTSDMLDVFEQQTPIIDIPLFGDYRFSLVKLPEGYYYPIQRMFQETTNGSEKVFYEYQRYYNSAWARGYWQNNTLLYVDYIIYNQFDYSYYSWSLDANNIPYLYQKDIYSTPEIEVSSLQAANNGRFYINLKAKYSRSRTEYNSEGEITGEYNSEFTAKPSFQFETSCWYYTRFKGNELMNKIDEVAHDIYAEYLKNQG